MTLVRVKQTVYSGETAGVHGFEGFSERAAEPEDGPGAYSGTMSGAPSRAASAVRSSGWRCDSRSASTRFS